MIDWIIAERIAAAVWLTPSKQLRRLTRSECRAVFPAARQKSRVVLDGEPGWFVLCQNDIDSVFGSPPLSVTKGRAPNTYWEQAEPEALGYLDDEGWSATRGELGAFEKHMAEFLSAKKHHPSESTLREHCKSWIAKFEAQRRAR